METTDTSNHHTSTSSKPAPQPSDPETAEAFTQAFLKFFQHMTRIRSLIIHLDDCQWMDPASLHILQSLATDQEGEDDKKKKEGGGLMLIVAHRPKTDGSSSSASFTQNFNSATDPSVLSTLDTVELIKQSFRGQSNSSSSSSTAANVRRSGRSLSKSAWEVTSILVNNLDLSQVRTFLADSLSSEPDQVDSLAKVILAKTHGNPFFMREVIKMLVEKELLVFQFTTFSWQYDTAQIEKTVQISNNVCDLMLAQMQEDLMEEEREVIFAAALLGFTFAKDLVEAAVSRCTSAELRALRRRGLIAGLTKDASQFTHDKIQEAAKMLYQGKLFDQKKNEIGQALVKNLSPQELHRNIFSVVNLLSGEQTSLSEKELANLHFLAGKKSLDIYAFGRALHHLQKASELFTSFIWDTDYAVAVDLYSSLIECQFVQHEEAAMHATYGILQEKATRNPSDLFRGSITMMRNSLVTHTYKIGLDIGLELLEQYNFPVPKRHLMVKAIFGLSNVVRKLSKIRAEDLLDLPNASTEIEEVQIVLYTLMRITILLNSDLKPFCPIRSVNLTLDLGVSDYSSVGIVNIAIIVVIVFEDFKKARQFVELAHTLLQKRNVSEKVIVSTNVMAYGMVWHWSRPMKESMKGMVETYRLGRKCGANEDALLAIFLYSQMAFSIGRPLDALASDLRTYMVQMESYNYEHMLLQCRFVLQAIMNLAGESTAKSELTGEGLTEQDGWDIEKAHAFDRVNHRLNEMILCAYFGDYERGYFLAEKNEEILETIPAAPEGKQFLFYGSFLCFAMSHESAKWRRKCFSRGRKYLKMMRKFAKQGDPNVLHRIHFLSAESDALKGRSKGAIHLYRESIKTASRLGYNNDNAFFRERLGAVLLAQGLDSDTALTYLANAHSLYTEWGAHQKAEQLIQKYPRVEERLGHEQGMQSSLSIKLI